MENFIELKPFDDREFYKEVSSLSDLIFQTTFIWFWCYFIPYHPVTLLLFFSFARGNIDYLVTHDPLFTFRLYFCKTRLSVFNSSFVMFDWPVPK